MANCSAWATEDDLCAPCLGNEYTLDPDRLERKLLEASELLYQWSGQQFPGSCDATVTPCNRQVWNGLSRVAAAASWSRFTPTGFYLGFPGCSCHASAPCNCTAQDAIELPADHVNEVAAVTIDGYDLDPSAYELQGNLLVRTDGEHWECCGDMTIDFSYGLEPPLSGKTAAATLACELYLACYPDDVEGAKCRLPRNISSIARQGVSVIFASLTVPGARFRTGLWEIDSFLDAFNYADVRAQSVVMSPDTVPTARIVT